MAAGQSRSIKISPKDFERVIHTFIMSMLDDCNSELSPGSHVSNQLFWNSAAFLFSEEIWAHNGGFGLPALTLVSLLGLFSGFDWAVAPPYLRDPLIPHSSQCIKVCRSANFGCFSDEVKESNWAFACKPGSWNVNALKAKKHTNKPKSRAKLRRWT